MIIKSHHQLAEVVSDIQSKPDGVVVFTNGVFDILHAGHLRYLKEARELGSALVVAVNSDLSVRRLKGDKRPIVQQDERMELLDGLCCVDYVTLFETDTPVPLIEEVRPAIYVKGGDYQMADLPEAKAVSSYGGQVRLLPFVPGRSTTGIVERIRERYS